uniref:Cytochrome b reductase 1 n=1 Tax=Cacopsylla melanoneura TaxID=428564 RepID=A0A8D8LR62_9HEMI
MAKNKAVRSYDDDDEFTSCNWVEYTLVIVLASLLLLAALVLVIFWSIHFREGYVLNAEDWKTKPAKQFNYHPTLMILGFITFSGFSMLLYRISRCCRHIWVKLFHTILHAIAVPCIAFAALAIYENKNIQTPPQKHFYSLHSWMGFITVGLFGLQFVVGFFSFLVLLCCEGATAACRAAMVPLHASFGLITFMMAIATCLTGLTQRIYLTIGNEKYSSWTDPLDLESIIINSLAMVLVALGILFSYLLHRDSLKNSREALLSERL